MVSPHPFFFVIGQGNTDKGEFGSGGIGKGLLARKLTAIAGGLMVVDK